MDNGITTITIVTSAETTNSNGDVSKTLNKTFNNSKNNCSLNFTVRIDNSSGLRTFRDLLTNAIAQCEEEIAKLKN